jgi:hypothetical protein
LVFLGACSSSHPLPPPAADAGPPAWQTVLDGTSLTRTLLSVWGTSSTDVFAVGGSLGNGLESLILHFDGNAWHDLHAGGTETFWWVYGTNPSDIWFVGEKGRMAHWNGSALQELPRKTTATLFGVFALAPSDAWAVGGTPEGTGSGPDDVVLHWDGSAWSAAPMPQTLGRTYYKVWGTASDNLYVVGESGTIWHKKGAAWALEGSSPPVAHGNLLTVFGCDASHVYAVGGRDVLATDGTAWTSASPAPTVFNDVNGVSCFMDGGSAPNLLIVGFGSLKQRLTGGSWIDDGAEPPLNTNLHGAWADDTGAFWTAGGDFGDLKPSPGKPRAGVIARFGPGTVPSAFSP